MSSWKPWLEETNLIITLLAVSAVGADSAAGAFGTAFSIADGGAALADTARALGMAGDGEYSRGQEEGGDESCNLHCRMMVIKY